MLHVGLAAAVLVNFALDHWELVIYVFVTKIVMTMETAVLI